MNKLFKVISLLLLQLIVMQSVWAAKPTATALQCSSNVTAGTAVINEIKTNNGDGNAFIEVYLLNEADINNWSLYVKDAQVFTLGSGVCTINTTTTLDNASGGANSTTWPAGTFIVCETPLVPAKDEVLLVDKSTSLSTNDTSVIDYLEYANGANTKPKWSVDAACSTIITNHDANNSDIARIPDGTGSLADNEDNNTPGSSNSGGGGGDVGADSFNCMELSLSGSDPTIKQVYTKLAGTNFTLDIVAIKNSAIDTNYNQTVTVEIIDQNNANAVISTQDLTFVNNTDNGKKSLTFNINNAYKNLACKVTHTTGGNSVSNISDNFSVRPLDFIISSILDNTTTHVAGDVFDIIATTATNNYTGLPVIDNTLRTAHADAIQTGIFAGIFPNASAGVSVGNGFTYSEVGNFTVDTGAVVDSTYTSVDQPILGTDTDCRQGTVSNDLVNGMYGCNITNSLASHAIGRFIPAYFEVTSNTDGTFSNTCVSGGFTYTGQAFTYDTNPSITLTAYNSGDVVTQNYTGDYNKLADTDFVITTPTTDKTQLGADGVNKVNLTWSQNVSPILIDNSNGTLTFTLGDDDYTYTHEENSKTAPFIPEVELNFTDITDSDLVPTKMGMPLEVLSVATPYILTPTDSELRFGRLAIGNAYGSELVPLPVPMYTEYYNGSDFVFNTSDTCTSINLATDITLSNDVAAAQAGNVAITIGDSGSTTGITANIPFVAGNAGLSFSAANDTGYVDINSDNFIITNPWLSFDWDGDGVHDNASVATVTFGLFNGGQKQIFFREVY